MSILSKTIVKSTKELIDEILSGNPHMVRSSCCALMKMSQDDECIKEFVHYLDEIKEKTANLNMGGAFAPNDRFVKKVIKILEHYKTEQGCSCCLLDENDNPNYYKTITIKEVSPPPIQNGEKRTIYYNENFRDGDWVYANSPLYLIIFGVAAILCSLGLRGTITDSSKYSKLLYEAGLKEKKGKKTGLCEIKGECLKICLKKVN